MAATLSAATLAAIAQAVRDALASDPIEASAASSHFKARDLPCGWTISCGKTFRTVKGQTFHNSAAKHAIAK
jgi:hypothetical protein